jgi:hypothetical protein
MSSHICDPYELGLLAAIVKALPLERQPKSVRAMTPSAVGKVLALENIASVSYSHPGRGKTGVDGVSGPKLLDDDVMKLAGASAVCLAHALASRNVPVDERIGGTRPQLAVTPDYAVEHAKYVSDQSCSHPGWKESIARGVCRAVERAAEHLPEASAALRLEREVEQWGFSEAVRGKLGDGLLPEALVSERIEAEGEWALSRARQRYPLYGYCIVDRDGSRGPLGVVRDPKHCAQIAVRMNDARDPAINGPYRMVEMRAVPAHEHPPFGRDEHTLGYGIVSTECPLVQTGDGRTSGELIFDGLSGVLEEVRLRNVDATGDLTGTKGPWSAVELRAVPVEARRAHEFAQPDVPDLDIVGARGKVLGLRESETPRIAGALVGVAQKLRALAIREDDGLVTALVAPDGNSLANFKGLFGKAPSAGHSTVQGASTEGLESITASVRERIGERIDLQVMSPTIVLATLGDSIYEGRASAPPIPWESVPTLRFGAGDRLMGEVLGVHHFPETNAAGKPYTAAVEMHLGHPLVRKDPDTALGALINAQPVLVVADMRPARWRRPDGDLAELGDAKAGDLIDVRMDVDGKTLAVRTVERELGADGSVRIAKHESVSPSRLNLRPGDLGNAVILGPTSSGKSMSMVPEFVARHLRGAPNAVQEEAGTSPERGAGLEDGEDEDHGR